MASRCQPTLRKASKWYAKYHPPTRMLFGKLAAGRRAKYASRHCSYHTHHSKAIPNRWRKSLIPNLGSCSDQQVFSHPETIMHAHFTVPIHAKASCPLFMQSRREGGVPSSRKYASYTLPVPLLTFVCVQVYEGLVLYLRTEVIILSLQVFRRPRIQRRCIYRAPPSARGPFHLGSG